MSMGYHGAVEIKRSLISKRSLHEGKIVPESCLGSRGIERSRYIRGQNAWHFLVAESVYCLDDWKRRSEALDGRSMETES